MNRPLPRLLLAVATATALAACSSGPSAPAPAPRRAGPAPLDPPAMVAAVRAAGQTGVELEVQPLRDPQVEDLRDAAAAQERAGRLRDAEAALDRALAISVDDPDLLQWKAELALLRRAWEQAEQLANSSYERGPKLGGLCRRNWATVEQSRLARGDAVGAANAGAQIARCTVAPPVRM
ncbi:hypothetical protein [Arenimonas composti]|uniref:Tetratricopeptide repeat protein n=1 Tax=Arenimonas composti TR7-09 = DSM 18010 TaxID=1121013 RepID=A0A091BI35_9GAMM|nr:hypothetical protein [Arenimonas composti]KFN51411.1 hypothetical protein P873_02790 [Arenimonas composti TR7-09 = DSM 18010]